MGRTWALITLAASVAVATACSAITGLSDFELTTGAGAGGGTGSGGAAGSGGSGGAGGSLTGGGHGGAPVGGGVGGSGGSGGQNGIPRGCDVDGDGSVSVACAGGTDCDDDNDGFDAIARACEAGTDCDDTDPVVHPDQTDYFETEHATVGYDYNCSGAVEQEFEAVICSGLQCTAMTNVFLQNVPCGQSGAFGDCSGGCGITIDDNDKIRRCR